MAGRLIYCGDHCVTFSFGGHAFLAKLLSHFSLNNTLVVEAGADASPPDKRIASYKYVRLRFPLDILERSRWSQWHARWVAWSKRARGRKIAQLFKLTPEDCLITIAHDFVWIPVVEAAQQAGAKCLVFCDDEWVELYGPRFPNREAAARLYAGQLQRASRVFAVSEGMKKHLKEKYGVDSEVFYKVRGKEQPRQNPSGASDSRKPRLVYTGQLWQGYWESLKEVVQIGLKHGWEIEILTNPPGQKVAGNEFSNVRARDFLPEDELVSYLQQNADALVVALPFVKDAADLMKTMFSSKMVEYTLTDRPTIILAPPHAEMARWGRESGCFLILDSLDPADLEKKLVEFMGNAEIRKEMGTRARELGDRLFAPERAKEQVMRAWKGG